MEPLLDIRDLAVDFGPARATNGAEPAGRAVDGVTFALGRGGALGLVGASGSGKTTLARAVMGLVPPEARVTGEIRLAGQAGPTDLLALDPVAGRRLRARELGMIFQEPTTAFNPVLRIGFQVAEALRARGTGVAGGVGNGWMAGRARRSPVRERGLELLRRVALPDPESCWNAYPHQLSGGQRQRAMIAMALAGDPCLLLADEPTTALDVTIQARVLALLAQLRAELGLALLLITHDLAVVAQLCDHVVVLEDGRVVEAGPVDRVYGRPTAAATRALLAAARTGLPPRNRKADPAPAPQTGVRGAPA